METRNMNAPSTSAYLLLADRHRPRSMQLEPGISDVLGCRKRFAFKDRLSEHSDPGGSIIAILGTAIHAAAERAIRLTGRSGILIEHKVTLDGIPGKLDRYEDKTVIDLKTVSSWRFKSILLHGADQQHIVQVDMYAKALTEEGYEVESVRLDYLNRDTGKEVDFSAPYDERMAQLGLDWINTVRSLPF